MDFLNSSFLWGLPLIAVPVVIHLLNRRRREVVRWGAMQFLLEAVARRRRRWRLEDLLLMLLRAGVVAAIVVALAQPRIRTHWLGAGGQRDVILVVDDSLSTALVGSHGSAFEAVCGRAEQVLSELNKTDFVRILKASQPPEWVEAQAATATAVRKQELAARLRGLKPTLATADMVQAVRQAIDAEPADAHAPRVITVVTDGRANGWHADVAGSWGDLQRQAESAGITVHVLVADGDRSGISNLSLDALTVPRAVVGVGERVSTSATIRNTGERVSPAGLVRLLRGQEELSSSALPPLDPGQTTSVALAAAFELPGVHLLRAEIASPDDLPLDNAGQLAVEVVEQVPVLVVGPTHEAQPFLSDTGYLAAVLGQRVGEAGPGPRCVFRPKVITADEMTPESVHGFRCILLVNVPGLSEPVVAAVKDAVRQGTGLWVVLGDRTDASFFNSTLYAEGQGFSPLPVAEAVGDPAQREQQFELIPPPAANHPATRLLADTSRLDIDRAKVFRRWRWGTQPEQPTPANVGVLLATGHGEPLAVEKAFGHGRVIVQGVPLDVSWSNLPLCQAFVVMVHEWLWYLAEPGLTQWNLAPGEALTVSLPADQAGEWAEMVTPGGARLKVASESRRSDRVFVFGKTLWPGVYELNVPDTRGESRVLPCVVNRDPKESNLAPLGADGRQMLASAAGLRFDDDATRAVAAPPAAVRPKPMWPWLLVALLGVMLVELLLSGRITRRRFDQTPGLAIGAGSEAPLARE